MSCEEDLPLWLVNLEKKLSTIKQAHQLGHEQGAGAPCLKCGDDCPGLNLHFWRKRCTNCKCKKEDHDVVWDDNLMRFEILLNKDESKRLRPKSGVLDMKIKTHDLKKNVVSKQYLPGVSTKPVQFDWIPPNISRELAAEYMDQLPLPNLPITGTSGAKFRQLQLEKQIPLHDISPIIFQKLNPEERNGFQKYLENVRNNVVGQGKVQRVVQKQYWDRDNSSNSMPDVQSTTEAPERLFKKDKPSSVISKTKHFNSFAQDQSFKEKELQRAAESRVGPGDRRFELGPNCPENLENPPSYNEKGISNVHLIKGNNFRNMNVSPFRIGTSKNYLQDSQDTMTNLPETTPASALRLPSSFIPKTLANKDSNPNIRNQALPVDDLNERFLENKPGSVKGGSFKGGKDSALNKNKIPNLTDRIESCSLSDSTGVNTTTPTPSLSGGNLEEPPSVNSHSQGSVPVHPGQHAQQDSTSHQFHDVAPQLLASSHLSATPDISFSQPNPNVKAPGFAHVLPSTHRQSAHSSVLPHPSSTGGEKNKNQSHDRESGVNFDQLCDEDTINSNSCVTNSTTSPYNINLQQGFDSHPEGHKPVHDPSDLSRTNEDLYNANNTDNCVPDLSNSKVTKQELITERPMDCYQCNKEIPFGSVAVLTDRAGSEVAWHPQCFICDICQELLVDMVYFYHEGKVYCGRHYADKMEIVRCFACDELIFVNQYTVAEGKSYHLRHFCCVDCDVELAGLQYLLIEDQPVCLNCYDTHHFKCCQGCKLPLKANDQGVVLNNLHWHARDSCFKCANCASSMMGKKLILKNNKAFCSKVCFEGFQNKELN